MNGKLLTQEITLFQLYTLVFCYNPIAFPPLINYVNAVWVWLPQPIVRPTKPSCVYLQMISAVNTLVCVVANEENQMSGSRLV